MINARFIPIIAAFYSIFPSRINSNFHRKFDIWKLYESQSDDEIQLCHITTLKKAVLMNCKYALCIYL